MWVINDLKLNFAIYYKKLDYLENVLIFHPFLSFRFSENNLCLVVFFTLDNDKQILVDECFVARYDP